VEVQMETYIFFNPRLFLSFWKEPSEIRPFICPLLTFYSATFELCDRSLAPEQHCCLIQSKNLINFIDLVYLNFLIWFTLNPLGRRDGGRASSSILKP
jgi:hypothetical protein